MTKRKLKKMIENLEDRVLSLEEKQLTVSPYVKGDTQCYRDSWGGVLTNISCPCKNCSPIMYSTCIVDPKYD